MKHAKLSASSSHRWLACPPILALEEGLPDTGTSYSREGTDAHTLSELKLRRVTGKEVNEADFENFSVSSEFYNEEMEEMTDMFVDRVVELYNGYDDALIELEQRVSYAKWAPGGFGTSDVVIATPDTLEIVDLKYGKGVQVYAKQNPQLMLYALGSYEKFNWLFDFETIKMTIVQPRLDHIDTFEIDVQELLYWANNYVAPRAAQADIGIGDWDIEKDVLQFSKVRAQLRPRALKNFELLERHNYKEAPLLELNEIADILKEADEIKKWIKDIEYYALEQVRDKGETLPGFKLVEGRSNRKVVDEQKLATKLASEGFTDIYKPLQLETITKLEKLVGKNHLAECAGDLLIKPQGKPVLVPETDKRPAIGSASSAIEDFEE